MTYAEERHAEMVAALDALQVGDGVRWTGWSDTYPGYVVERTASRIVVEAAGATLLNGFTSDAPDALQFSPGGFFGHTEGRQRYEFHRIEGASRKVFTRRKNGEYVEVGHLVNSPGGRLYAGIGKHHDYNF